MTTNYAPLQRARDVLRELGYGPDYSWWNVAKGLEISNLVPKAVAYCVYRLAYPDNPSACWSCWDSDIDGVAQECIAGRCAHLGPEMPMKELLTAPKTYGLVPGVRIVMP